MGNSYSGKHSSALQNCTSANAEDKIKAHMKLTQQKNRSGREGEFFSYIFEIGFDSWIFVC